MLGLLTEDDSASPVGSSSLPGKNSKAARSYPDEVLASNLNVIIVI